MLTDKARAAARELLGEVKVVEEGDQVIAEVDLGRVYMNPGAQDSLPELYITRIQLL